MKRNKTQIKWLKTVFVISLFSLGLLQTPISVSGDWSEDFSDISDWLLKAYDVLTWEENGPFPEGTHHWQQVDGKLYSEGSPVAQNTADIACHNATIEEGYWTIEATGQFHIYLVDAWDPDSITRKDTGISVNLEWSTGSKLFANLVVIYSKDGYINAYQSAREITPQDVYKVKIAFDDTLVAVYINDELTLSQNTQFIRTKIPDDICLWGGWPGSPVTYDNLDIKGGPINVTFPTISDTNTATTPTPPPDETDDNKLFSPIMAVGLGIAVSTIAAYYSIRYVKKKRMIREYKLNGPTYHNVKRRVATVFNNKRTLYYLLVGLSSEVDKDVIKKVKDQVPQEIYAYKFLFNPVRLAYMHLLFAFDRLTSKEIKEQLGLSWNDFTNTSKLLQEKGYIRTETGIFDGKLQQVVTIEELGREDFSTLIALLEKLIHETKSFENYLSSFTFDLYPEN